ncbi:MAG: tRNA lysidine(34) synthetase TilS, partial [Desulfovibrio sp.]|nr:tRNA lysidine(34) synthetase TilS [Desulfovibrio sp.]
MLRFVEKDLGLCLAGKRLVVAYSGGADSTALLLACRYLAPKAGFSLHAAHLNHQLRPSAAAEAAACENFCRALGLSLSTGRADVAGERGNDGAGLEEAARNARYAFLERTRSEQGADAVATGHNNNDLAEDILMRLIRGAGWPGLAGMPAWAPERKLFRPLLLTPRKAIEDFLSGLTPALAHDESNEDDRFFRNRVRRRLLPAILKENPSFLENAAGLWRLGGIDARYFDALLDRAGQNASSGSPEKAAFTANGGQAITLPRSLLGTMPKALRLRLYKRCLAALGPGQARLDGLLALDAAFVAS